MFYKVWLTNLLLVSLAVARTKGEECSPDIATERQEWGTLTAEERSEYIDAIWCLRGRHSVLESSEYPGVRDRLDDFVATHINYTTRIHANAVFLPWHRHFLFLWERTLQDECGYNGTVPYWDWSLELSNLSNSPLFDGSATSLSGNGIYEHPCDGHCTPEGTGGGCVTSGPFKDFEVHLGPFHGMPHPHTPVPSPAFNYNPRCLKRDFNPGNLVQYNSKAALGRMRNAKDIAELLYFLDPSGLMTDGAHATGHNSVGGGMADLYTSPQDPVFMLHHGMVDRMWALWQNDDMDSRRYALNGTAVINNEPGTPLVTPEFVVEFGPLDRPRPIKELMDPLRHDYCYRYN